MDDTHMRWCKASLLIASAALCQTIVTVREIFGRCVLTGLLFSVWVSNKCFPLRESLQEVVNYCSGLLIHPRCAPPASSAGLQTHLNIDRAPGRTAWGPGPLACSRALLIGAEPSCQYHSSTQTWRLRFLCIFVFQVSFVYYAWCICLQSAFFFLFFPLLCRELFSTTKQQAPCL